MNDSWFFENFTGVPDDFFDDAMECLDIPLEDGESNDVVEDWDAKFQHLVPPPSNVLAGFSYSGNNSALKSQKSCLVLCDESSQPKQHRTIPLCSDSAEGKQSRSFWTSSSPVSVLESSSSSSSVENPSLYHPKLNVPVKRPRSKRPRSQRRAFSFIYALNRVQPENHLDDSTYSLTKKKQQKRKNLVHLSSSEEAKNPSQKPTKARKCTHCEVTKTPQWREGPMGPKTLCNACGVRYRSGRLFPEYRPAASPTFVPTVHSNSHRKVIVMRKMGRLASPPAASNGCPLPLPAPVPLPTE